MTCGKCLQKLQNEKKCGGCGKVFKNPIYLPTRIMKSAARSAEEQCRQKRLKENSKSYVECFRKNFQAYVEEAYRFSLTPAGGKK